MTPIPITFDGLDFIEIFEPVEKYFFDNGLILIQLEGVTFT